jgi:hypothetical protein
MPSRTLRAGSQTGTNQRRVTLFLNTTPLEVVFFFIKKKEKA